MKLLQPRLGSKKIYREQFGVFQFKKKLRKFKVGKKEVKLRGPMKYNIVLLLFFS